MAVHSTQPTTLGERVKAARKAANISSVEKLRDRVLVTIPARYVPSVKLFYRLEADEITEESVDGILIVAIANATGQRVSAISPMVAAEQERVDDLLASTSRWIPMRALRGEMSDFVTQCEGQLLLLNVA